MALESDDTGSNWSMPLIQGPLDIGFHESLISDQGIQNPPYNFTRTRNDMLDFDREEAKWWTEGSHNKHVIRDIDNQ